MCYQIIILPRQLNFYASTLILQWDNWGWEKREAWKVVLGLEDLGGSEESSILKPVDNSRIGIAQKCQTSPITIITLCDEFNKTFGNN